MSRLNARPDYRLPVHPHHPGRLRRAHHQLVVMPDHDHRRVTGPERIFEQPWGMDRIMAEVHLQLVGLGLMPRRRFVSDTEQWMYADFHRGPARGARAADHLDGVLRAMGLPVIAFFQEIDPVLSPPAPKGGTS